MSIQQQEEKVYRCPANCGQASCLATPKPPDLSKKPIVWVLGGPGVGKGTQCANIVKKYGYTHLSTGDLLREEVKAGSERSEYISRIMKKGDLVPTPIVLDLLIGAIQKNAPSSNGFLIDGYPREEHQGQAFEEAIAPATAIIYLEATAEVLEKRLLERAMNSKRFDDTAETIKARIKTFFDYNEKVIASYPPNQLIWINAEGDVDTTFKHITKALDPIAANYGDIRAK